MTPTPDLLFAGIDVGTQGVRVALLDRRGRIHGRAESRFETDGDGRRLPGAADPEIWWTSVGRSLAAAAARVDRSRVLGLAVTSTSGTLVLLDDSDRPLGPALLYDDEPALAEAESLSRNGGATVAPTAPLARLTRERRRNPSRFARVRRIVHAADYVAGKLTGEWASDWSHALKSGFDPETGEWSPLLERAGFSTALFPPVSRPGTEIGRLRPSIAELTGLSRRARVFTAMTDGCAAQIAAGASFPGEWATSLGTTLVLKGVSTRRLDDPRHGIYSHRHPDGFWMPGGASNVGGDCLERDFPGRDLRALEALAAGATPSGLVVYPLRTLGERFPFAEPRARGFTLGHARSEAEWYAALLEGVAYVERLAYETLGELGVEVVGPIASAGGGARSALWMQIRSDVLDRPVRRVHNATASTGAAILAAKGMTGEPLARCVAAMVHRDGEFEPRASHVPHYRERYAGFVRALATHRETQPPAPRSGDDSCHA